jgi:hypothetical protein
VTQAVNNPRQFAIVVTTGGKGTTRKIARFSLSPAIDLRA